MIRRDENAERHRGARAASTVAGGGALTSAHGAAQATAVPRGPRAGKLVPASLLSALVVLGGVASTHPDSLRHHAAQERLLADPGLGMRAAIDSFDAGEATKAQWLLDEVGQRHPVIGDYALWLRSSFKYREGDFAQTIQLSERAIAEYPASPLRIRYYQLVGNARASQGDEVGARKAWRASLDDARDEDLRAELLLATAQSEEREGDLPAAAQTYVLLWYLYPDTAQADSANEWLDAFAEAGGRERRTGSDWRRRADALFRARHNDEALATYDRALAEGLSPSQERRAKKQRAHTLFRMRRYPEAVEAFSALERVDDVPLWRARSLARAGQVPQAVKEFEELGAQVRGDMGLRSLYLAGLLLEGRDRTDEANAHFEVVAASRTRTGLDAAALWRLGWAAYRKGETEAALEKFERLVEREKDPIDRLRARYWRARALEQLSPEGDAARSEFVAMGRDFPLTYYGWRSLVRLEDSPQLATAGSELEAGRATLGPEDFERPRILLVAGLLEEARDELGTLERRARTLEDRLRVAQLYSDAREYHRAQRLIVDAYNQPLARGPVPNFEELWWHAWPAAFGHLVGAAARNTANVDAELVLSIMREESGYRAEVISPNGARGLLQIMEETGERLARRHGMESFHADDLFEPEVNIALGSRYLGELLGRFEGRLSAAIASYNAGPNAVSSWIQKDGDLDDDEWVESIPYDQTRGYVKRVLRSMYAYRLLY